MMKTIHKTSIGFAIGFLTSLASGVGSASTFVIDLNASRNSAAQVCASSANPKRVANIQESIRRSSRRASRLAQLLEANAYEISQLEEHVVVDYELFTGVVHSLRELEKQLKEMIHDVNPGLAKELGLLDLRRNLALARSNAVTAELMAWQTTAAPEITEGATSGEALAAVAEKMTNSFA